MKSLITKSKNLIRPLAVVAMASFVFASWNSESQAQIVDLPDCKMTRMGCLDKNPPKIPVDQPLLIQIGLQINIKCEALSTNGQSYAADIHLVKNMDVQQEQTLNYYLVPGNHGTLSVQIDKTSTDDLAHSIYIKAYKSQIQSSSEGLLAEATMTKSTRTAYSQVNVKLNFSNSTQDQPLKILSAEQQITTQSSFNEEPPKVTTTKLNFSESNCVYY